MQIVTSPSRLIRQIFPPDRIREGWCENCQTCEIANLPMSEWVSEPVTIISARDASASEKVSWIVFIVVWLGMLLPFYFGRNGRQELRGRADINWCNFVAIGLKETRRSSNSSKGQTTWVLNTCWVVLGLTRERGEKCSTCESTQKRLEDISCRHI